MAIWEGYYPVYFHIIPYLFYSSNPFQYKIPQWYIGDFSDDKSLFGCYTMIPAWSQKLSRFHRFALYI